MSAHNDTRYGFPLPEWKATVEQAKVLLIETAREGRTITYGQLCSGIGAARLFPRSWALLALIGEASDDDALAHGAHLASLVVRASDGMPGEGYFRWAERAGFDVRDRRAFWESEVARVYSVWQEERSAS